MITERLMSLGGWELRLSEDTPSTVLDAITPYSHVGIFPGLVDTQATDASILAQARYVGVVTRPGPQRVIGGPGLAMWLGNAEGVCFDVTGTAVLPATPVQIDTPSSLNAWVDDIILPGSPFARGTTGPGGNMTGTFRWVSPREVLDVVAANYAAEWRINTTFTVDVSTVATLYGSTPTVVVSRRQSGRENVYTSVQGDIASLVDVDDYASKVTVLGRDGSGSSGGASSYIGPTGTAITALRVLSAPDVPAGSETNTAATFLGRFSSVRREVTLRTDHWDVAGEIEVGAQVYLYDPESGIHDVTATPIEFRGEWIRPVQVRCMGMTWPVAHGMGVALRTHDGSSVTWTDITNHVEWEQAQAEIDVGAARR